MDQGLRVFAVGELRVSRISESGRPLIGSWIGRDRAGVALPEGESIPFHPHYVRALNVGELTLAPASTEV